MRCRFIAEDVAPARRGHPAEGTGPARVTRGGFYRPGLPPPRAGRARRHTVLTWVAVSPSSRPTFRVLQPASMSWMMARSRRRLSESARSSASRAASASSRALRARVASSAAVRPGGSGPVVSAAAQMRHRLPHRTDASGYGPGMAILVGTASWTDPEFIKAGWYPPEVKNDAAGRLRYYAEHFPMVEVNASFYALPRIETVEAWVERTPPGFRFHVKAHQVVSGHPSDPRRLPEPLRELPFQADKRGRIRRPSRELRDAVIDALMEACGPMGTKLGAVLLQLPPFVAAGEAQAAELERILRRFRPLRVAVEFRHRSWVAPGQRERTMDLLAANDAAYVCVDAPRLDTASAMPPIAEVTCDALAYLRLHGRNRETWHTGTTVAERYDHVYTEAEMREWLDPVLDMAERAQEVAVVFNNNARDHALRNADDFRKLLQKRISDGGREGENLLPGPYASKPE